jgi:5-deoxy-glucuronate isomerase
MSDLLVRPVATSGRVLHVTPDSAGWTYVGFSVLKLAPGETFAGHDGARETCLVLVSGTGSVVAGAEQFVGIGGRQTPWQGAPHAVYVPAGTPWQVTGETALEVGVCTAPGTGARPVLHITPDMVGQSVRGTGTNTRYIRDILPDTSQHAESLLVVEVITPPGHWSSYPPHKHDRDALPAESLLEETYYHRINPAQGFAVQRVYTDDLSLDETLAVRDGEVVLVPRGYHPVGAPHGYELYYLNVMAGPRRIWKFHNDPNHAWLMAKP